MRQKKLDVMFLSWYFFVYINEEVFRYDTGVNLTLISQNWQACALGSGLVKALKLAICLGDASERFWPRGGTTNVATDTEACLLL